MQWLLCSEMTGKILTDVGWYNLKEGYFVAKFWTAKRAFILHTGDLSYLIKTFSHDEIF